MNNYTELYYYFLILLISCILCNSRLVISDKSFAFLYFTLTFFLSLIIRSKYDFDIINYSVEMEKINFELYYLREPILWYFQSFLYLIVNSSFVVFLISDFILYLIIYKIFIAFKLPQYSFLSFILFFPSILGFQNIYRQYAANIFFLYIFSLQLDNKIKRNNLFFILPFLTHNITAIFYPIILRNKSLILDKFILLFLLFIPLIIYFGVSTKSDVISGNNSNYLYILFFLLTNFFLYLMNIFKYKIFNLKINFLFFFVNYLLLISFFILSFSGFERLCLFIMKILFPFLVTSIQLRIEEKFFFRIIFVIFGFFPILFSDTRSILIN